MKETFVKKLQNSFLGKSIARLNKKTAALISIALGGMVTTTASAVTAPAAGSFAYDLYDVGVNLILNGAPGFIAGMGSVIWAATKIQQDWKLAALGILGGSALLKADDITASLGVII